MKNGVFVFASFTAVLWLLSGCKTIEPVQDYNRLAQVGQVSPAQDPSSPCYQVKATARKNALSLLEQDTLARLGRQVPAFNAAFGRRHHDALFAAVEYIQDGACHKATLPAGGIAAALSTLNARLLQEVSRKISAGTFAWTQQEFRTALKTWLAAEKLFDDVEVIDAALVANGGVVQHSTTRVALQRTRSKALGEISIRKKEATVDKPLEAGRTTDTALFLKTYLAGKPAGGIPLRCELPGGRVTYPALSHSERATDIHVVYIPANAGKSIRVVCFVDAEQWTGEKRGSNAGVKTAKVSWDLPVQATEYSGEQAAIENAVCKALTQKGFESTIPLFVDLPDLNTAENDPRFAEYLQGRLQDALSGCANFEQLLLRSTAEGSVAMRSVLSIKPYPQLSVELQLPSGNLAGQANSRLPESIFFGQW